MTRSKLFVISLVLVYYSISGQDVSTYLKNNAIRVENPDRLSDSVYNLLSPFQVIMMGEMHGTNEPAQFVTGLAKLLTSKGDSVQVGLEIPAAQMTSFLSSHTDSSMYQSEFFATPPYLDGRESIAWAGIISRLKNNPRVQIFFYDITERDGKLYNRDSLMYLKIKAQINLHPTWKMITISGNSHNRIYETGRMGCYLYNDKSLNLETKICALNHSYLQGTCLGDFGHGIQIKQLGHPESEYDTTLSFDKYLILASRKTSYAYTGMYYTKNVTASELVKDIVDIKALKKELAIIFERDQKTRTGADSAAFMSYIDSCLQVQVKSIIAKYGWPGTSFVGGRGNQAVFLVIQHADSATQEKYFPMMQQSVEEGESRGVDMAMMQDRILMREGKKQIYGSQVVYSKSGEQMFYPIEDEKNVNIKREKVGLQPLEEYAKYFGIDYKLPTK